MRTAPRKALSLMIVAALFAAVLAIPATAAAATGTKLTITASGKAASIYHKVKLTGKLTTAAGAPIKQVKLRLMKGVKQASGETSWTVIAKPQTNAKGRALVNVRPAKDAKYKFVFLGNDKYEAAESSAIDVTGYQPNTIELKSSGAATETVTLQKGLAIFSLESTSAPFKVTLLDKSGKLVSTLVDSTDAAGYKGETALKIAKTGKYSVIVSAVAGSPWTVKIVQPRKLKARTWATFSGTGDQVSDVYALNRRSYRFIWTNPSGDPIKIVLRNQAGDVVKTITDSSAKAGLTHVIKVPKGLYVIEVDAGDSATWTVAFKK